METGEMNKILSIFAVALLCGCSSLTGESMYGTLYRIAHTQVSIASPSYLPRERVYQIGECAGLTGQDPRRVHDLFDPSIRSLCTRPS